MDEGRYEFISSGTAAYRRMGVAVFAAGFATFACLYAVQPMMSVFAEEFDLTPSVSSLVLSLSSFTLAAALLAVGVFADGWNRLPLMRLSLLVSVGLSLLSAWSPTYAVMLMLRIVLGAALAGVPSVIMAYVGEECDPSMLGRMVGLCISGNVMGGMTGRMLGDALSEWLTWRLAIVLISCVVLSAAVLFWRLLPPAVRFRRRSASVGDMLLAFWSCLKELRLLRLYVIGALLMGSFTAVYNYAAFRLLDPPFRFTHAEESLLFLPYVLGAFSSYWAGRLSDRFGHVPVLAANLTLFLAGIAISVPAYTATLFIGVTLCTLGFFGGHSVASGWVNRLSAVSKAQSASLYLFFYYVGSGAFGTWGGVVWSGYRWPGIAALVVLLLAAAFLLTAWASREQRALSSPPRS